MLLVFTIFSSLGYRYRVIYNDPGLRLANTLNMCSAAVYESFVTVMGIASTLIIVRSALGVAFNDEESFKVTVSRDRALGRESRAMTDMVFDIRRSDGLAVNAEGPGEDYLASAAARSQSIFPG
ncbi:hypothetical protein PM082_024885 [Marasmius tenuissimus]|nr:hypothetical protein PM082_024885 [Marasmius tenuissimus]